MPNLRDVFIKQEKKFDQKKDDLPVFRAVLCDSLGLDTGSGSVWANQDERLVWYRPLGVTYAAQVRCVRLEPQLGLGVIIGFADGSNEQEVLSDDPFLRNSGGLNGGSYLSVSGRDLEPGGRLQMWLYSKAFVPLMTYAGVGLSVSVVAGDYEDSAGVRQSFTGAVNLDISGSQPAGPNEHCLVGIYISSAGAIGSVAGATVATSATAPEPSWPAGSVPLSVVDLNDTQTTVSFADDIEDRRLYFPYPGSGAILKTFVDAKGDLITATADNTPAILTVGANNTRLIPDSGESAGLRWGRLDKFDATTAPTANDDSGDGYEVGSVWVDTTADAAYICLDDTLTAAVWSQIDGSGAAGVGDNLLYNSLTQNVWQRNTTFSDAANDTYTADRWNLVHNATTPNRPGVTRQNGLSGQQESYFMQVAFASNSYGGVLHFLEKEDTRNLRGEVVSLSFDAWGSNVSNLRASVLSWTGLADSITSDVVSSWGAGNPTLAASWAYLYTPGASIAISGTSTRYSVENISVPTTANNVAVFIWTPDQETNGDYFNIARVKLEIGATATTFVARPVPLELFLCRRYYQKSYPLGTFAGAVGQPQGRTAPAGTTTRIWFAEVFQPSMRTTPTTTIYSYNGTAGKVNNSAGTDIDTDNDTNLANVSETGANSVYDPDAPFTAGTYYFWDWVADAEL